MTYIEGKAKAEELIRQDKYADALRLYSTLRKENDKDKEVFEKMVFLTTKILEGNYDFEPETSEQFAMRGVARFYHSEPEAALIDLDKAISLEPNSEYALQQRAFVNRLIGDFKSSVIDLEKLVELYPIANHFDELGSSYSFVGDKKKSLYAHKKAVEKEPTEPIFWYNYGCELMECSYLEEAVAAFDKAIRIKNDYEDAIVNRMHVINIIKGKPAI